MFWLVEGNCNKKKKKNYFLLVAQYSPSTSRARLTVFSQGPPKSAPPAPLKRPTHPSKMAGHIGQATVTMPVIVPTIPPVVALTGQVFLSARLYYTIVLQGFLLQGLEMLLQKSNQKHDNLLGRLMARCTTKPK